MSRVEPIVRNTVEETADFLHSHLNSNISVTTWATALEWGAREPDADNCGFLLRDGNRVVGAYAAVYSTRLVRGRRERFCNLHSWCVLESHRGESLKLVRALLSQPDFNFFNPTPNPLTVPIFEMLKFKFLDSRVCGFLNVPRPGRGSIVVGHDRLKEIFKDEERRYVRDHRDFPWIDQVAVGSNKGWCHLAFRRRTWKRMGCAEILHVGNPDVFLEYRARFQRWLMLHRGLPTMQVEARFFSKPPSRLIVRGQPRMALGGALEDRDYLNLYTDLMALAEEC